LAGQVPFIPAMNPNRFLALALFAWLAAAPTGEARAQWVQTNGLFGDQIVQLAASQTRLFAEVNTNYGVFCSFDEGLSWPNEYYYRLIGSIGTNIYAVLDSEGIAEEVYTWSESGSSWIQIGTILTADSIISVGGNDSNLFMGVTNEIYLFNRPRSRMGSSISVLFE
jgi:hypothetical protein